MGLEYCIKKWRHVDKVKGLCEKKQGNDTVRAMGSVQYGKQMTSSGSKQIISSKQMAKLMKRGETVYLAMIRPTQPKQRMTQKVKFEQMKKTGPI